ncbi:MAG: hypothetical protein ACJAVI_004746 [Candidatus Azotimanducaceae bacterium]|jgi:hypothetical protein
MLTPYFEIIGTNRYTKTLTLLLSLLVATTFAAVSKTTYAEPLDYEQEIISLNVNNSAFNVAFFFEKTGNPKGGVILTYGQTDKPFYLNNIAYVLARNGWSTVLVGPSESQAFPIKGANGSKQDPLKYSDILTETIRLMREEKGQYNLVILAHGTIWGEVNDYVSDPKKNENIIQGLVMLDIKEHTSLKRLPVSLPLLDLITTRLPPSDFHQRKIEANRYKLYSYTQVNLPSRLSSTALKEDQLAKRIRGWLRLNIQGMELNKNNLVNN